MQDVQGVAQAVLTQQREGVTRPVAIVCRKCTVTKKKMGDVERRLYLVTWAVKQLRRYTAFAKKVRVHLPEPEAIHVVAS